MSDYIEKSVEEITSPQYATPSPFPGLRPFKIEENHLFFGREGQSDEVLIKLSRNRFAAVIGPSGSGKSSFVFCGVLPILYGGFLSNTSTNWEVIVTRPGAGPIDNLATALLEKDPLYIVSEPDEQQIKRTITSTLLRSSSRGLAETVLQFKGSKSTNYLILIDQFEELFRYKKSGGSESFNETLAFVNLLIEAANYPDAPIYIAITMRSDFIGDCAQFPRLTKEINDSNYLIPKMTREQMQNAVEGPVAVGGAHITPRLVQQLLNDLGDNPDQLPILQHSLMRTWNYWGKYKEFEGEPLDTKHYEAIGTMTEALSQHANEAYDELDEEHKRICESLFKSITEKRGESFGIRRPTRLAEIAEIAGVEEEEVIQVIERFRQPGRSLVTPVHTVDLDSESIIDITHESLMRIWVRLKNWVDDEAEAANMYLRLSDAASMYEVGKAALWRPPDLQLALNWKAKHNPTLVWGQRHHPAFERTMVFLDYSQKEFETEQRIKELQAKRKLRNSRIIALVLGGAAIISLLFLVLAFLAKIEADKNFELANKNLTLANEQTEIAKEQTRLAKIAEEQALEEQKRAELEKQRAEAEKAEADRQRLLALEQQARAERGELLAQEKTDLAEQQRLLAVANEGKANVNAELARQEKLNADRLRYLAIAKSMAIKSTQFRDEQATLKGLLAQQAYAFNTQFQGETYDHDIYNGLYYSLKSLKDPLVKSLSGHNKGIRAIASASKGNYMFTAGTEGKIIRWTPAAVNPKADTLVDARANRIIRALAASPDNSKIVAGGKFPINKEGKSFIELFDIKNGKAKERQIDGFTGEVWKLLFTQDGKGVIALDNLGKSIKFSDLNTVKEVVASSGRLNDIILSTDGKWLYAAAANGNVYRYDVENAYASTELYKSSSPILSIAISALDDQIAIGDQNGLITLIDTKNPSNIQTLIGHISQINSIAYSTDGRFIASASKDQSVRLWNRSNLNAEPMTFQDHPTWVWTIAFSPNNEQIYAGTQETVVRSWPTRIESMAEKICDKIDRNMTIEEWKTFVGNDKDLKYQSTCKNFE